ncbi:hypothetical protein BC567DRAFT_57647 [Phyllosticta citribraziliensis]
MGRARGRGISRRDKTRHEAFRRPMIKLPRSVSRVRVCPRLAPPPTLPGAFLDFLTLFSRLKKRRSLTCAALNPSTIICARDTCGHPRGTRDKIMAEDIAEHIDCGKCLICSYRRAAASRLVQCDTSRERTDPILAEASPLSSRAAIQPKYTLGFLGARLFQFFDEREAENNPTSGTSCAWSTIAADSTMRQSKADTPLRA